RHVRDLLKDEIVCPRRAAASVGSNLSSRQLDIQSVDGRRRQIRHIHKLDDEPAHGTPRYTESPAILPRREQIGNKSVNGAGRAKAMHKVLTDQLVRNPVSNTSLTGGRRSNYSPGAVRLVRHRFEFVGTMLNIIRGHLQNEL